MSAYADISQFLAACKNNRELAVQAGLRAMDRAGEQVLGDAQELCPVETGFLKASAYSQPAFIQGNVIKKVIGFNADYAFWVHECLDLHHPDGQAKFLETAMRRSKDKVIRFVLDAMEGAI